MKTAALTAAGKIDEALRWVTAAIPRVIHQSDVIYLSELHRSRGDAHLAGGDFAAAEEAYQAAIQVAREQEAMPFERRAREALELLLPVRPT
jgi:predicted negative regulator of RcsB-dependent stress response